jgi:CheY-like chemotaxis protein
MSCAQKNVLVVDDDPGMLRLLVKWLKAAGYNVRQAADGKAAATLIEEACPDLLITDWEMPGMNGLQLIAWLRARECSKYVYIVALTIRGGLTDIVSLYEAGTDDYLKKPVDKDELIARLMSGVRIIDLMTRLSSQATTPTAIAAPTDPAELKHQVCEYFDRLTASELMQPPVTTIPAEAPLRKAVEFLTGADSSEWPVVHSNGTLAGLLHEQDLFSALLHKNAWDKPLRLFVRQDHTSFSETTPALEVYGYFCRSQATSVPVVQAGVLRGIIYRRKLLMQLTRSCDSEIVSLAHMQVASDPTLASAPAWQS